MSVALSVVVPAYNEAQRIGRTLRATLDHVDRRYPHAELIVVDDGSRDDTAALVQEIAHSDRRVRLLSLGQNRGKGAAVRAGMAEARGGLVLFMDADLATPLDELEKLRAAIDAGADVALGSRGMASSRVRRSQGKIRQGMGQTFNRIVQAVLLPGVHDTQCGFKLFTREAAQLVSERLTVERFAFDVEMLLIALDAGLTVVEVPIEWFHDPQSRVSPFTDATRMLLDVMAMRLRRGRRTRFAKR